MSSNKKKVTIEQIVAVFPDTRHEAVYKVLGLMNSINTDLAVNNEVIWDCVHEPLMLLHNVIDTVIWEYFCTSPSWKEHRDVLLRVLYSKTENLAQGRSIWRNFIINNFEFVMMKLNKLSKKVSAVIKPLCSKYDLELGSVLFIVIDAQSSLFWCNAQWYIISQDKDRNKPRVITQLTTKKVEVENDY
jgi:hypothetical protein